MHREAEAGEVYAAMLQYMSIVKNGYFPVNPPREIYLFGRFSLERYYEFLAEQTKIDYTQ